MKTISTIVLAVFLTGCVHNPTKPNPEIPKVPDPTPVTTITKRQIIIDDRLFHPCSELKPLESNEHTALLLNLADNVIIYRDCVGKHQSLVKFLKQLSEGTKND